jgi:hypothetical protein
MENNRDKMVQVLVKLDVEGNVTLVVYVRIMHNLFKMFLLK